MDILKKALSVSFQTATEAENFLQRMKQMSHSVGYVTVNDILRGKNKSTVLGGGDYGYDRKVIRKAKVAKWGVNWTITLPAPSKIVRDANGYWKAEKERSDI